ncbi:unnamed protein product [Adineta steineri]|uniref:DUF2891 domain-containing protein n=1 Tax=Adineta steineri TaxID=433720 RepID=A0A815KTA7_9BILA|nr:unnamed protein product [Adineta steineri]CAF3957577.1 unnamed protein product [Adineta steineri]
MRRRFADLALSCVHREYPNKLAHVLSSDDDVQAPRDLTPAFFGCYDWHSAVHGHWLLARLARIDTNLSVECRQALGKSFTQEKLENEMKYISSEQRQTFERPYGLAWFLQLTTELDEWANEEKQNSEEIRQWRENIRPLETLIVARLSSWLPKLSYPVRSGEHSQTAFALGLSLDYARRMNNTAFAQLIEQRSLAFYLANKNYPFDYEPSGEDFLSAGLAEADLMRRVMYNKPQDFVQWFNQFLPTETLPVSLEPPSIADPTDPKLIHLAGLCLSRAWMLEGIVDVLSFDTQQKERHDQLLKLSQRNAEAGLIAIDENHYEGGHWLVSIDNFALVYYVEYFPNTNSSSCEIKYSLTTCDFVYSVVVPVSNNLSFVYNCIDFQGNNVIGYFICNRTCNIQLSDEQIVYNYTTQDNFVIAFNGDGTGIYGIADDFVLFYKVYPTIELIVWSNNLDVSPRAMDIGSNQDYAVVAGYCQSSSTAAVECGFIIRLNSSLSCPISLNKFDISNIVQYPWSDPRSIRLITQSRTYIAQLVMSVSICWQTQHVLIGIQSLNTVFLYSLNDTHNPISTRQNGLDLMGYGKSVAWLDKHGNKAVILANTYSYSTYQWISSSVHIYDIQSDGFSDLIQPIYIYPNSQQIRHRITDPSFIRIVCSSIGHLGLLDRLGNGIGILVASPNTYSNTNTTIDVTSTAPCNRGTSRNYSGIELCYPQSSLINCSEDFFCPYGAVGEVSYSAFKSIEQYQEYPDSPENIVFDDLLIQNMFIFNPKSIHCLVVSPITWVLFFIIIGFTIAISISISEVYCPDHHFIRDRAKRIFRKMDLIGEGEMWFGGLISAAIIVLVVSAYYFSNAYLHQYPIEYVTNNSTFACDITLRNAKFTTTTQKRWDPRRSTKESQHIFDLLNSQLFTLNIDLVQTSFTCEDYFYVQRLNGNKVTIIPITNCQTNYNETTLSLTILLPVHQISVQLVLPGLKTIGAIRIGLSGPSAEIEDGRNTINVVFLSVIQRFVLMALDFASTYVSSSPDEVLAESSTFSIELTQIVNQTDPLTDDGSSTFSAIWSSTFNVNSDELFTNESRYTFFYRTQTNISVIIDENIFYVRNLQQPIARQTEIVFRSLLFTIVVLEVFGLLFLLMKLFFIPVSRLISKTIKKIKIKYVTHMWNATDEEHCRQLNACERIDNEY